MINRKSYGTSVYESDAYKFDYVYDRVGNIKTATVTSKYDSDYVYTVRYGYDEQNQLVSERCAATNRAYVYEYDTYGNIRSKKTYTYGNYASPSDIAANCTLLSTDVYEYDDYEWFDLLTEYNNVPFSHDIIGNPLTYYNGKNYTFTWQNGRQMASASVNGLNIGFEYDIDGLRTKKTVQNGETYNYYYSGSKLHAMTWENGAKMLSFLYDSSGAPYSMVYCYTENSVKYSSSYYYVTNLQGDVIALMNANHAIVAEYLYDAWGNILSITDVNGTDLSSNATHIANLNPLRYRGYVYDNETGFYYLQSRYYDPVVGRFVNLDGFVSTGTGFSGFNMFAYCNNNPVMYVDDLGTRVYPADFIGPLAPGDTYENNYNYPSDFIGPIQQGSSYSEPSNEHNEPWCFYDSKRFNTKASYREQMLVVEQSTGFSNTQNDKFGVNVGRSVTLFANGWEFEKLDLSLFDFFKASAGAGFDTSYIGVEAKAALWSPTISYEFETFEISIGADILSIGGSYGFSKKGFKFSSITQGISFNLGINIK